MLHCKINWKGVYIYRKIYLFVRIHERYEEKAVNKINFSTGVRNFKSNLLFFLSGGAFLIYSVPGTPDQLLIWLGGLLFALLLYGLIAMQCPSIMTYVKADAIGWKTFYFITTVGICWSSQIYFYKVWSKSSVLRTLSNFLPAQIDWVHMISVGISIMAFFFLYAWVTVLWRFLRKHIAQINLFSEFSKKECIVYSIIFLGLCVLAIFAFTHSEAFYGTDIRYDIVYTSDSTEQVRDGVYTSFWHSHNCIKQPMFTLFASPFSGALFFVGKILGLSAVWSALVIDFSQIALLMCSVFILAKMLHLNSTKRVCFVFLFFSGYTALLSVIMMEQFVVSLFWLLLLLHNIAEKKEPNPFILIASGSVVVTNLVCTLLLSNHVFTRNYKAWIKDMCRYALYFIATWIGCGKITTLLNFTSGVGDQLSAFGGADISLYERICQYTTFIKNYFLTPEAGPGNLAQFGCTWPSWQLAPATGINVVGVVIFILALFSVWINRDKRSCLLAGGWILFSVFALCILGWGSAENGMILYSLYFGWPFFILLFQFVEKIEHWLHLRSVLPIVCIICITSVLICNISALNEMIEFVAFNYPN